MMLKACYKCKFCVHGFGADFACKLDGLDYRHPAYNWYPDRNLTLAQCLRRGKLPERTTQEDIKWIVRNMIIRGPGEEGEMDWTKAEHSSNLRINVGHIF